MKRIKARTMVISSSRSFVIVKYILKCEMLTFSLFILQLSMRGSNYLALDKTLQLSSYDTCAGYLPIANNVSIWKSIRVIPIFAQENRKMYVVG
ncbi:hypothetical protein GIB67_023288, partial [Kingdonia uniflora]